MSATRTTDEDGDRVLDATGCESRASVSDIPRRRVYLVGFMAAGKSSVGSALASELGFSFKDLDRMIEESAGARVHEIFEQQGEEWFRNLEHECLLQTEAFNCTVIATGGGTMTFERNREVIRRLGVSVWIAPSLDVLFERLDRGGRSKRPLYRGRDQARALYHRRQDAYRMADLRIKPSSADTADGVAARIAALLRARNCVI